MIAENLEARFRVFGEACHIVMAPSGDPARDEELLAQARAELHRIEEKYDAYAPNSVVALINEKAGTGEPTALDAESTSLFNYVHILWEQSSHIFDPTTSLIQQHYASGAPRGDEREILQTNLQLVGWDKLKISDMGATLSVEGMTLDLNSCVRPYAVDCVRKLLSRSGVSNALIDLDNDVATIGKQTDGSNWLVGTRYPAGPRTAIERFKLNNRGYAIRGDFERILTMGGERFPRVLSPVDGQPIPGLITVAVIAENCLTACSAVNIARLKTEANGLKWLENLGMPWLAIDRDFNCHGPLMQSNR